MPPHFGGKEENMKFPYSVKHNGVWYAPNEEIPENSKVPVAKDESKVEKVIEVAAEESTEEKVEEPVIEETPVEEPAVVETPVEETKTEPTYTKTEINRMPIVDLRRLARKHGIKQAAGKSGAELKAELIDILKL